VCIQVSLPDAVLRYRGVRYPVPPLLLVPLQVSVHRARQLVLSSVESLENPVDAGGDFPTSGPYHSFHTIVWFARRWSAQSCLPRHLTGGAWLNQPVASDVSHVVSCLASGRGSTNLCSKTTVLAPRVF